MEVGIFRVAVNRLAGVSELTPILRQIGIKMDQPLPLGSPLRVAGTRIERSQVQGDCFEPYVPPRDDGVLALGLLGPVLQIKRPAEPVMGFPVIGIPLERLARPLLG